VLLLPLAVVGLVVAHVLLVRRHGVVPPFQVPGQADARAEPQAPVEPQGPAEPRVPTAPGAAS
jgi:ubiquinol-cytochrome c reductase cytochrome b subunit